MGDQVVKVLSNKTLIIVDAVAPDNPVQVLWDGNVAAPTMMSYMQWSPDGLTIAFSADDGNLWTVPVSGAAPPKKVLARALNGQSTKKCLPLRAVRLPFSISCGTLPGVTLAPVHVRRTCDGDCSSIAGVGGLCRVLPEPCD
jgi:hypothetical protein